jgi:hypothetical protein
MELNVFPHGSPMQTPGSPNHHSIPQLPLLPLVAFPSHPRFDQGGALAFPGAITPASGGSPPLGSPHKAQLAKKLASHNKVKHVSCRFPQAAGHPSRPCQPAKA